MRPRTAFGRDPRDLKWLIALCWVYALAACAEPDWTMQRERMISEIEADMRRTQGTTGEPELSPRVREAIRRVERHRFVPESVQHLSYINSPLPIGSDQTISQPYIVALMTQLVRPQPDSVILEVGTGSGYQAAVLAELAGAVHSIEILPELADTARKLLAELGYGNVHVYTGDGYAGIPEHAPYDGILVTAAPDHLPAPLVQQLKPGGRMVIPVGGEFSVQKLVVVKKEANGDLHTEQVLPVRFVPLTGDHAISPPN